MTGLQDILEDFGAAVRASPVWTAAEPQISDSEIEGMKLESFESGYKAGWDDAVKAHSDDRARISSALGQHLQDLSFTYHEAYSQVMNAVTPLLNEMVQVVLPEIARASLAQHIADQLAGRAKDAGALDVMVAVSPSRIAAVRPLLEQDFGFPIELVEDDTLDEEQADIRFGETETQIDLGDLVASVKEAVDGFTHDNRRKIANG